MTTHVFGRNSRVTYPVAVAGDGCFLIDANGKRYLDGSGGAAISCLGHSNAKVRTALHAQLDRLAYAHTSFFTSEPAEALADELIAHAPSGLDRVYLVSGGSEAVETALKLARQYFTEIAQPERHRVIARRQSYHGNTLGALAAGGSPWRRRQFTPLLLETSHIAPCYAYRGRLEGESEQEYGLRVANELEAEILRLGSETVMAFIAEPVVGASMGAVPAVAGYFQRIRQICDTYGVLLILDEVMCGMGRTGTLYSCEYDGISPDMLTIAKGLGAGYQPIGATLCSKKIFEEIRQGSGFFQHGHSYIGHPMAAAGSIAVLDVLMNDGVLERVNVQGEKLYQELNGVLGQHPHVGDLRGRGLFYGVELVAERESKQPFDPSRGLHLKIKKRAMDNGLLCYPMGGTIDGNWGDHILLAPPFIISDEEIGTLVSILSESIDQALAS